MACSKNNQNSIQLESKDIKASILRWMNMAVLASVVFVSFAFLNVNPLDILGAPAPMIAFLGENFFPPSFGNLIAYSSAILDTLFFAVAGTYLSAILSFILGVLMSERLNPNPIVRSIVRYFVSFLRNIPTLIWAQLLIFVFGVGNMVGLIALVFATVGFLARSYAESMDDIAGEKLEAIKASGASYMQVLVHGLIPEFVSAWLNWTLFSFEINIRVSAILGIVGAGGMGILIQTSIHGRNFTEASTLVIMLIAMVLLTELTVGRLRKKLA